MNQRVQSSLRTLCWDDYNNVSLKHIYNGDKNTSDGGIYEKALFMLGVKLLM